jgi:membrane protease YdiL (CAAX protease family)
LAARVFTNEQLVNPAWEPVSIKGLKPGRNRRRQRRLPAVDEALALFAAALLLSFYIAPELMKLGIVPMHVGQQVLLLAGPALLLAWIGKYDWVATFSWRRPALTALLGGLLLGVGLSPWCQLLAELQAKVWPPNPEQQQAMMKLLFPLIERFPILMPLVIGALAGLCEETLFRGPIQVGLLRRMPKWVAIVIASLLFAAAHLDLFGLPIRTFLGIVLGWTVVRTGSVFPAMLLHGSYDAAQLLVVGHELRTHGSLKVLESATTERGVELHGWMLGLGAVLVAAGYLLLTRSRTGPSEAPRGFPVASSSTTA